MRWAGYVAHMGEMRGAYRVSVERGDHLEDLGVEGVIIIRYIFMQRDKEAWTLLIWFRLGTGGGHF